MTCRSERDRNQGKEQGAAQWSFSRQGAHNARISFPSSFLTNVQPIRLTAMAKKPDERPYRRPFRPRWTARRPRVAARAPHEASLLRLASALLCEQNDELRASKRDLDMNPAHTPRLTAYFTAQSLRRPLSSLTKGECGAPIPHWVSEKRGKPKGQCSVEGLSAEEISSFSKLTASQGHTVNQLAAAFMRHRTRFPWPPQKCHNRFFTLLASRPVTPEERNSGGRDRTYDLMVNSHPLCR